MKKIILFLICLLPWFLTSLIPFDQQFYHSLTLPFFAPPNLFYIIFWTITYFGIAISIYKIITIYQWNNIPKSYKRILLINYICNQSFTLTFSLLNHLFLSFICCLATFITSLYLYEETDSLNEKSTKYLNPYVLLSLFATVLSITIYIINSK